MNILLLGSFTDPMMNFIEKIRFVNTSDLNIYRKPRVDFKEVLDLLQIIPHKINYTVVPGYDESVDSTDIVFIYEYKHDLGNEVVCDEYACIDGWWKLISSNVKRTYAVPLDNSIL